MNIHQQVFALLKVFISVPWTCMSMAARCLVSETAKLFSRGVAPLTFHCCHLIMSLFFIWAIVVHTDILLYLYCAFLLANDIKHLLMWSSVTWMPSLFKYLCLLSNWTIMITIIVTFVQFWAFNPVPCTCETSIVLLIYNSSLILFWKFCI